MINQPNEKKGLHYYLWVILLLTFSFHLRRLLDYSTEGWRLTSVHLNPEIPDTLFRSVAVFIRTIAVYTPFFDELLVILLVAIPSGYLFGSGLTNSFSHKVMTRIMIAPFLFMILVWGFNRDIRLFPSMTHLESYLIQTLPITVGYCLVIGWCWIMSRRHLHGMIAILLGK